MSDCCSNGPSAQVADPKARCPQCGVVGKPVSTLTLKHIVKPQFLETVDATDFTFCPSADCDLVYFHPNGVRLAKADVRVRVGLKETEDPVPICYCFGFTEAMARDEIRATGKCTIPDRISTEMKRELCACEVRNPQGSCCFANVSALVKRLLPSKPKPIPPIPVTR